MKNWYKIAKKHYKFSKLFGEWWIYNGTALFADGDYGDMNHEAYVIEYAQNILKSNPEEDFESWKDIKAHEIYKTFFQDNDENNDVLDTLNSDPELFLLENMNLLNIDEDLFYLANGNKGYSDIRLYAMKNWKWKRVEGKFVETFTLSSEDLKSIAEGLYDAYESDIDSSEESGEDIYFTIEVRSNNTLFNDVPYSLIDKKNISELMNYRMKSSMY